MYVERAEEMQESFATRSSANETARLGKKKSERESEREQKSTKKSVGWLEECLGRKENSRSSKAQGG
jgi:hypothetical protein